MITSVDDDRDSDDKPGRDQAGRDKAGRDKDGRDQAEHGKAGPGEANLRGEPKPSTKPAGPDPAKPAERSKKRSQPVKPAVQEVSKPAKLAERGTAKASPPQGGGQGDGGPGDGPGGQAPSGQESNRPASGDRSRVVAVGGQTVSQRAGVAPLPAVKPATQGSPKAAAHPRPPDRGTSQPAAKRSSQPPRVPPEGSGGSTGDAES